MYRTARKYVYSWLVYVYSVYRVCVCVPHMQGENAS